MLKPMLILLIAITLLGGCKSKTEKSAEATAAESTTPPATTPTAPAETPRNPTVAESATPPATAPTAPAETPGNPTAAESAPPLQQSAPPILDVGLSVEQAYAAIPHRRTVWVETDSTVPDEERAYLRVIFRVIDQAVAVRVAGQQNLSAQQFDSSDPVANYDRLIGFVRAMPVPNALATYHQRILEALAGQQQFFADWKAEREQFRFAQQVGEHAGVRNASAALRAAYNELMAKYPGESPTNKDAFFDYHCALDFL
jgi:hypothetical protein